MATSGLEAGQPATMNGTPDICLARTEKESIELSKQKEIMTELSKKLDLRKDIAKLIAPWQKDGCKPPFSVIEMALFAIIMNYSPRLDVHDIRAWIVENFKYYSLRAVKTYCEQMHEAKHADLDRPDEVIEGFPAPLFHFNLDTPLLLRRPLVVTKYPSEKSYKQKFTTTADAARVFLRERLEPARKGTFKFLDLSPELRNRIYEMVFKMPEPGIIMHLDGGLAVPLRSQSYTGKPHEGLFLAVEDEDCSMLKVGPLNDLLALLRTNKQVYAEAITQFYGINTFNFRDLEEAANELAKVPKSTMAHMRSLHIDMAYPVYDDINQLEVVAKLLQHLSLKKLVLSFEDKNNWPIGNWVEEYADELRRLDDESRRDDRVPGQPMRRRMHLPATYEDIPELEEFAALARRTDKVEIYGDDDGRFQAYLLGKSQEK